MTITRRFRIGAVLFATFAAGCDGGPEPLAPGLARWSLWPSLTATAASPTQIDLTWVDDARTILQFDIYRSTTGAGGAFTLLATVGPTFRTFSDEGLRTATEYCYRVRSLHRNGRGVLTGAFTTTACAATLTPSTPPATPSDVTATPSMLVRWMDNATDEDGFRIERSTDGGAWVTALTVGRNVTSAWEPWSLAETVVCYRVFAVNAAGDSPASNKVCTALPAVPGPVSLSALGVDAYELLWGDNSLFEDGYEVLGEYCFEYRTLAVLPADETSFRVTLAQLEAALGPIMGAPDGPVGSFGFYVKAVKGGGGSYWSDPVYVSPYGYEWCDLGGF